MKPTFFALIFSLCIMGCSAQQLQNRPVSPFNKIQISGSVNVFYTSSDSLSLTVKAKSNEMDRVDTKVVNSTLIISNHGNFKEPVTIYVKNSQLVYVETSGASEFESTGRLGSDSLIFNVSGATRVEADVQCKKIRIVESGASDITLWGTTDQLLLNVSGAASFRGYDLVAKDANILASGASSARVNASEKVLANATGASDVKIKGDAKDVSVDATSSADVVRVAGQTGEARITEQDTTIYHFRHRKLIVIHDRSAWARRVRANGYDDDDFKHWAGFSVGVNGYMTSPGVANLPAKYGYMDLDYRRSFNLQLNVIERQLKLVKHYVTLVTGLGIDFHLYQLANKTTLEPDSSYTSGIVDSSGTVAYKKNRLRNTYLQVPLLLEFNTSNRPNKSFHVAVGIIGQFLLTSRTKQVLEGDFDRIVKVRKDSYNMNPFAAKAHLNFGYKGWTIFTEYNLSQLFQAGRGPELYPFTVGLRVIPFA